MAQGLAAFFALLLVAAAGRLVGLPDWVHPASAQGMYFLMWAVPLFPAFWWGKDPREVGFTCPPYVREFADGALATVLILPGFFLLVKLGTLPRIAHDTHLAWAEVPAFLVAHTFTVVVPEELFFRGYLQRALDPTGGVTFFGMRLHPGLVLQALAFGLLHVVTYGQLRAMDRAIPALVFGLLKERTGTIWGAVLFHTACNVGLFLM